MVVLELDQTKLWCGTGFPARSSAVAMSCSVDPTFSFLVGAVTVTVATVTGVGAPGGDAAGGVAAGGEAAVTGLTVMVATPDFPSTFAATADVPTASAVTTPSSEMLTILGSCTVHVTAAPETIAPDSS